MSNNPRNSYNSSNAGAPRRSNAGSPRRTYVGTSYQTSSGPSQRQTQGRNNPRNASHKPMPPSSTVHHVYPLEPKPRRRENPRSGSSRSRTRNGGYQSRSASTVRPVSSPYQRNALNQYTRGNYHTSPKKRRGFPRVALVALVVLVSVAVVGGVAWGLSSNSIMGHPEKDVAVQTAEELAQQYDYDGAIDTLTTYATTFDDDSLAETIEEYEAQRAALVPVDLDEVTHVFYHSLIYDPSLAFANPDDELTAGFAQWMVTIDEFNEITQEMYDRGYVLVSLDDLYTKITNPDGSVQFSPQAIMLPPDKKAYVLSVDDLSYYHSYDDRGIASRLVLDDNGDVTCEYIEQDGTVITGAFDVVPLMNQFIEAHPDAAYKDARGTIALTGYNGIFGYRTDPAYISDDPTDRSYDQDDWLAEHPDFDYDQECADAKQIADVLKEQGWTMASHTWGHLNISSVSLDSLKRDTERWKTGVEPLVGETNMIIFAHGADMSSTGRYSDDNAKYSFLKSQGFEVFCNVDGSKPYSLEIHDDYVHQGRRNLDGYRLYHDLMNEDVSSRLTADLCDAEAVMDPNRPLDEKLYDLG